MSKGLTASPAGFTPATDFFSNGSWKGSVFLPVALPSPKVAGRGLGDRLRVCDTGASDASAASSSAARTTNRPPRIPPRFADPTPRTFPTRAGAAARVATPAAEMIVMDDM